MKKRFVLLTIPHAKCGSSDNCDKDVMNHANLLKKELDEQKIPNKMIVGNIERTKIDLNRKESRQTKFSKKVTKELNKDVLVLDIHSFFNRNEESAYFLKLDNKMDKFINCSKIEAKKGTEENYIINRAIKKGKKGILIEFNNDKDQKVNYRKLANCIKNEMENE